MREKLLAFEVSDGSKISDGSMYEAAWRSTTAGAGDAGEADGDDTMFGSFSSFFQHQAEDNFNVSDRLGGHFGQLGMSKYLVSLTACFFAILFLTGAFGVWRRYIRPRVFHVKQVLPKDRTDTQLAFRFSIAGFLLYLAWLLFTIFMYVTVAFLIIIYVGGKSGQSSFVVGIQKLVLVCDDSPMLSGEQAPKTSTESNFYAFHCEGWNLRRPDNVNAKLQTGFAFLYCWIVLTILMAFFYFADLYYMLSFAEVADLSEADTIGFYEDVWEQDESAFHTGEAGHEQQPQGRKQHERALTSRNLQPIQYVHIESERTNASLDRELRTIYDFDVHNGESDADGAAAPGETGGEARTAGSSMISPTSQRELKVFRFKCLKYVYDEEERMFIARKERLEHLSLSQILGRFFHGHERANANTDNASVRLGLGTLTYDRIDTVQNHFGKNTIEPHEDKTFLYCMYQEFTTSFMYVFQVQAALLFIFLDAFYITIIFETLYVISGTINAYYEYRNWNRILEMSRSSVRVKAWRRGYSAQSTQSKFYEMNSEELLPGDILEITDGMVIPCEAVLVYGSLLMDESSLTGESTPMEKEVAELNGPRRPLDTGKDKTHVLFAGTEVLALLAKAPRRSGRSDVENSALIEQSSTSFSEQKVYAVVTGIGTGTMKGDLIRTMFYPLQLFFEFDFELRKAWTYLCCLQPLVLLLLLVTTRPFQDDEHFEIIIGVLITGFTAFAQLVNPMIPTMQARASEASSGRLERKGIGCVEPKKIAQAGKVNLFCFDKTGTLTKEGMDFYGVCVNKGERGEIAQRFSNNRPPRLPPAGDDLHLPSESHITGRSQLLPRAEGSDDGGSGVDSGISGNYGGANNSEPIKDVKDIMNEMRQRGSLVAGDGAMPQIAQNFDEVAFENPAQFGSALVGGRQDSTLFALACCHSLSVGPDGGSIIGNPLEKEALKSVGWSLQRKEVVDRSAARAAGNAPAALAAGPQLVCEGPAGADQAAIILRKWKFDQSRQLQVTVCCTENVRNPDMSKVTIFAKGSMEAVTKLSKSESDQKISDLTTLYASRGFYVLGLCQAEYTLNWSQIEAVSLDEILDNASFEYLAMALFRNELRPESYYVIKELKAANVHTVMITGDSVYTGVAISKQVGLVEYCPYCITADAEGIPVWEEIDGGGVKNNHDLDQLHYLLKASNQGTQRGVDFVSCAINDKALQKITTEQGFAHLWHKLQPYIQVYGRVKPDGKRKVIRFFQDRSTRYVVAMAGDGGNDTGALKQAHVGVALVHGSQSEGTSNVVAPFVATEDDISKTVEILKEGRACLDTYIASFYLYTLYGLTWIFLGKIYMQSRLAFGNFAQFATLDFFFVLSLPLCLTLQGPRTTLATCTPDAGIAKWASWLYIMVFWLCSACVFFVLILTMRFPFAEPDKPDLDIRKVEDPMPAWYSPMSLTKEGFWYIGDIAGRSNNPDMALIFIFQCFSVVNIGIACVNGGMRPKGRKLALVTREDGRQTVVRVRDSAAAAADLEEGRPLMFSSSASSANENSASDRETVQHAPANAFSTNNVRLRSNRNNALPAPQSAAQSGNSNGNAIGIPRNESGASHYSNSMVGQPVGAAGGRQNVGGMIEQIQEEEEETTCQRFVNHPYKRHWITNPLFLVLVALVWAFAITLLFTKGRWWNYVWDVNSFQHQQGGELKDYFAGYHGTMRTMRTLREREIDEILSGDNKRVLALPIEEVPKSVVTSLPQTAASTPADASAEGGKSSDEKRQEAVQKQNEAQAAKHKQQEKQGQAPNDANPHESCEVYIKHIKDANAITGNLESGIAQSFLPSDVGVATTGQASPYAGYMEGSCAIHIRANENRINQDKGGTEQPHGYFQDLGWSGHSRSHTDTAEQERWCQYLCMNSWPYRADRNSFGCKFAYPSKNDCYLFQGNIDHFLHVQGMMSAEAKPEDAAAAPNGAAPNGAGGRAQQGQPAATTAVSFLEDDGAFLEQQKQVVASEAAPHAQVPQDSPQDLKKQNSPINQQGGQQQQQGQGQQQGQEQGQRQVQGAQSASASKKEMPEPTAPGMSAGDDVGQKGAGGGAAGMKDADKAAGEKAAPADPNKLAKTNAGDVKNAVVLDRYNVFGLEKSGYQAYSFTVFILVVMGCHTMCVIGATKGLRK